MLAVLNAAGEDQAGVPLADGHHARAEQPPLAADERLGPDPPPVVVDRGRVRQFHFEHGGVSGHRFPGGSAR